MTINTLPISVPDAPDYRGPSREPASTRNERDDFTRTYDRADQPKEPRSDESTGATKPQPSDSSSKEDAPVSEQPENIDGPVKASPVTTTNPEPPQVTTPELGKDPGPIPLIAAAGDSLGALKSDDAAETETQPVIGNNKKPNPWKRAGPSLNGADAKLASPGGANGKERELNAGNAQDGEITSTSKNEQDALNIKKGAQTKSEFSTTPGKLTPGSATVEPSSGASDPKTTLRDLAKADKLDSAAAREPHGAKDKTAAAIGPSAAHGASELKASQSLASEPGSVPSLSLQSGAAEARPVLTSTLSPLVTASAGGFAEPVRQIADAIRIHRADQTISVRLDPPELGTVSIDLTFDKSAKHVTAVVAAEQPDTASLLRRQLDSLQKELTQAGFSGVDVEFSGHAENGTSNPNMWFSSDAPTSVLAQSITTAPAPQDQNIISTTRIDARF